MIPAFIDRWLVKQSSPMGARYRAYRDWKWGDPHVRVIETLCDPKRAAVDVGAHLGEYTYFMQRGAKFVHAVEPNPELASLLRQSFRGKRIKVHEVGLSDHAGQAELRAPIHDGVPNFGQATIEERSYGDDTSLYRAYPIEILRLDDLISEPIGMLKVDAEGHEPSIFRGATRILTEDRPNIIVELEERWHPGIFAEVLPMFSGLGYDGIFLFDGVFRPIDTFDPSVHQVEGKQPYAWNFIFSHDRDLLAALKTKRL